MAVSLFGEASPTRIIVLLGPPGGGKGTQAEKITAEFGIPSISTGELLRAEVKAGTELGRKIQAVMQKGDLVSDDIVNQLIAGRLKRDDARKGVILDGYPRTLAQARFLDRLLKERKLPPPIVLNLSVPDEEIVKRLAARGRPDDKPDTVRERLKVYSTETRPLLDYYASKLRTVDGTGEPGEVYRRVRQAIESQK
jgi:adenylate kinase